MSYSIKRGTPFESRYERRSENECWPWIAGRFANGYGCFAVQGKSKKAHRIAYELACGPIPDGLEILHKCDNRSCVNPNHLQVGTHAENMADAKLKGRIKAVRGTQQWKARLTDQQITEIRAMSASCSRREIQRKFGLIKSHVAKIVRRECWKHIP